MEPRQGGALDPRGELHRLVLVEGLRQGRDHHLGEPSRRTTRRSARTARSTSPAAARGARRSPGTPTRRPGCATRTRAACWSRCTARPRQRLGDPVLAWADVVGDPEQRRRYQRARGKGGLVRVSWTEAVEMVGRRARAHDQDLRPGPVRRLLADPGDVDGVALRRHPFHPAHRRRDDVVLRLVRRPAGGQPAGVRRPDRRPGVRRLVGRHLPDDVGLQRPGHPHAGRALDGRGPLPRHQGRHRQPGLRRQHQVRRRVAARPGRHRRRPGDGHGPRDAQGVLRRARSAVLRRLRAAVHRPAVPGPPRRARRRRPGAGARQVPHRRRPRPTAARPRTRVEDRAPRRRDRASRWCPTARWASATPSPVSGRWNLDLEGVAPALTLLAGEGSEAVEVLLPRFVDADGSGVGAAPRRAGPPGRRAPGDHGLRPDAGPVRRRPDGLPGEWPTGYDDAGDAVHAGLAGRASPACRPSRASGSRASSPATPRSPAAAP